MNQAYKELMLLIEQEEQRISTTIPPDGVGLMEIARTADIFWVAANLSQKKLRQDVGGVFEFGLDKALKITLQDAERHPFLPLVPTNPIFSKWAEEFILYCGRLGECEFLLEMNRVGLCSLEKTSAGFEFRITAKNMGIERFERQHFRWLEEQAIEVQKKYVGTKRRERIDIRKDMKPLVQATHRTYMTYDTRPHIDAYYTGLGEAWVLRKAGHDSFPRNALFGGIPFGEYRRAIEIMVGWSVKHLDFAHILLKKRSYLNQRNLYTLINPKSRVIEYMRAALEMEEAVCVQILDALTLSSSNFLEQSAGPGNYISPSYISIGDDRLISPIWGNLSHPFIFLLTELKRVVG